MPCCWRRKPMWRFLLDRVFFSLIQIINVLNWMQGRRYDLRSTTPCGKKQTEKVLPQLHLANCETILNNNSFLNFQTFTSLHLLLLLIDVRLSFLALKWIWDFIRLHPKFILICLRQLKSVSENEWIKNRVTFTSIIKEERFYFIVNYLQ